MSKISEQYENNPEFFEFLDREFEHTVAHATIEELAEFAFGSLEKAIEAFNQWRKNEIRDNNESRN